MNITELTAYVRLLFDNRTDLDAMIAQSLAGVHREVQTSLMVPGPRGRLVPRVLDWDCQMVRNVAAVYVPATGIAVAALVPAGGTLKRVVRLVSVDASGQETPVAPAGEHTADLIRSGDVVAGRQVWQYRNGALRIEPTPNAGAGTYRVDLLQILPVPAADGSDWFTANLWEPLAKATAARVASDLGEGQRPSRWEDFYVSRVLAWHADNNAKLEGGAVALLQPPRAYYNWQRGAQW
jgi:hypothetical protein